MSDLISRHAAIEALERRKDKTAKGEIGSFYNTIIQHDIDVIVELPSAQPEETFEFGKWYDFKRGYVLKTTPNSFRILKDVEVSSNE